MEQDQAVSEATPDAEATQGARPEGSRPRISVIGTGYLGATHAAAMAELGFEVVGVDVDPAKVEALSAGKVPFYEPGLPEMLFRNVEAGRLRFTTDVAEAAAFADVHFVCVGTPQRPGSNGADLRYVQAAFEGLAKNLTHDALLVGKSTVPVGTGAQMAQLVREHAPADLKVELAWNPEFLREGKAVQDTIAPDRLVIGGASSWGENLLRAVYAQSLANDTPFISTDLATAELVKVSANAFLATKISFINAISQVCEKAGADVTVLADAIGHDIRIGRQFLNAGLGFGGGCLPKDIRALMHRAGELEADWLVALMQDVDEINMWQRQRVIDMTFEACQGSVLNRRIGVLGAAFKPDTDDVRDSPALNVAAGLHLRGAQVTVYDPEAGESGKKVFPSLSFVTSTEDAVSGTDVLLVLTEWPEFREADPAELKAVAGRGATVIDARNCLDPARWRTAGWTYLGLGTTASARR